MKEFLSALVLIIVPLSLPQPVVACSCAEPDDVKTAFAKSNVVVAAEVIAVSKEVGTVMTSENRPYEATFEIVEWTVDERWKGPYHRTQRFKTRTVVTCCVWTGC